MLIETKELPRTKPGARGVAPRLLILECDVCHGRFERPWRKPIAEATFHRCSLKCAYGSRRGDGGVGARSEVIVVHCAYCNAEIRKNPSGIGKHDERHFCDRKCYGAWRSVHPEEYAANTAAMHMPEAAKKISTSARARMNAPGFVHPMQGKRHTDETKQKISTRHAETGHLQGERNPMHGRHHTIESREKMSEGHSLAVIEGRQKTYGKNGHVRGDHDSPKAGRVHHRSSWELACMRWLDEHTDVAAYEVESLRIPYWTGEQRRWYVPDLLITFADGRRELWEVKPAEFIDNERTRLKTAAAQTYCEQEGIARYRLLTRFELKTLEILPREHNYLHANQHSNDSTHRQ